MIAIDFPSVSDATGTNGHSFDGGLALHPKMRILAVDDEPLNVALLEDILRSGGYLRVQSLTDSRLVLQTCETFAPDLIVLDLNMPFLDGFTILENLCETRREIFLPVIVLTADASEETKRRALRAGATDFLLKPFDELEVLLRINNMLEIRRLQLQIEMQRAAFEESMRTHISELRAAQLELEENRG
ncbi:MAG: response regulator [Chthoniobacterales bacterium]